MKKIIVTGQMRSGTTFFANFLNTQDKIVCYADFIRSPFKVAQSLNLDSYSKELSEKNKNILYAEFKAECDLFKLPLYKNFSRENYNTFNEFLEACYSSLAEYSNKKQPLVVGNKITHHEKQVFELLKHNYIIFYLIRDPRDIILSSKNRFANHHTPNSLYKWKKSYDYLNKYTDNNLIKVRYEDFINKKPSLISEIEKKLCINLDFDIDKLILRDNIDYKENSSFSDVSKPFDSNAIFRWKNNKDDTDVKLTNSILNREIQELGYEEDAISASQYSIISYYKTSVLQKLKKAVKSLIKI